MLGTKYAFTNISLGGGVGRGEQYTHSHTYYIKRLIISQKIWDLILAARLQVFSYISHLGYQIISVKLTHSWTGNQDKLY